MAAPRMVQVKYVDPVGPAELMGTRWEVPADVKDPAAYIRSQHREQQARITADQEREAREKQVLKDRVEAARTSETVANLQADLQATREALTALEQRFGEAPDVQQMTAWNAASAAIYDRSMLLAEDVQEMQTVVGNLLDRASELADAAASGHQMQETALQVLQNHQEIINGQMESSTVLINSLQNQLSEAESEVMALRARAADSRETIEYASAIANNSEAIARQVAEEEMKEVQESFAGLVSLMFSALGIDENHLVQTTNEIDLVPGKALALTYPQLREYAAAHQRALQTMADARQRNANLPSQTESV